MQKHLQVILILPLNYAGGSFHPFAFNQNTILDISLLQLTFNQSAQRAEVQYLEEVEVCRLSAALDSAHRIALGLILLG